MTDHMNDIEILLAMDGRLKNTPSHAPASAHIEAAIMVLRDIDDPAGAADRRKDGGHRMVAQCNACGRFMSGEITCGQCVKSGGKRRRQAEAAA